MLKRKSRFQYHCTGDNDFNPLTLITQDQQARGCVRPFLHHQAQSTAGVDGNVIGFQVFDHKEKYWAKVMKVIKTNHSLYQILANQVKKDIIFIAASCQSSGPSGMG